MSTKMGKKHAYLISTLIITSQSHMHEHKDGKETRIFDINTNNNKPKSHA